MMPACPLQGQPGCCAGDDSGLGYTAHMPELIAELLERCRKLDEQFAMAGSDVVGWLVLVGLR